MPDVVSREPGAPLVGGWAALCRRFHWKLDWSVTTYSMMRCWKTPSSHVGTIISRAPEFQAWDWAGASALSLPWAYVTACCVSRVPTGRELACHLGETYETTGARCVVGIDPVCAVVRVEVLTPVSVETAACAHDDCLR